jgi:adenosylcobinamide-GDP ribazoletransferase
MPLAGRCALVIELAALSYARPEGGLGAVFAANKSLLNLLFALAVLAATASWGLGRLGFVTAGAVVVITLIFSGWCRQRIGGFTGDTLGAACELAELAPALVAAAGLR